MSPEELLLILFACVRGLTGCSRYMNQDTELKPVK